MTIQDHVHSKDKAKRHRGGRHFGPSPVEIDTEKMPQEEIDAILADDELVCVPESVPESVPEVPKAEIDEVSHELLDEILTEDEAVPSGSEAEEVVPEAEEVVPEAVKEA